MKWSLLLFAVFLNGTKEIFHLKEVKDLEGFKNLSKKETKALIQNDFFNGWESLEKTKVSNRKKYIELISSELKFYSLIYRGKSFHLSEFDLSNGYYSGNYEIKIFFFNNGNFKSKPVFLGSSGQFLATTEIEYGTKLMFDSSDSLTVISWSSTFSDIIDDGETSYYSDTVRSKYYFASNEKLILVQSDTSKHSWQE